MSAMRARPLFFCAVNPTEMTPGHAKRNETECQTPLISVEEHGFGIGLTGYTKKSTD